MEIELQQAILFIHDRIEKDAWLEEYFPKQMEVYHQAIEQTREQIYDEDGDEIAWEHYDADGNLTGRDVYN